MPDQPDSAELPKKFVMDFGPPGVPQDYVAPLMLAPLILDLGGQVTNTPVSPPNLEEARTHTYTFQPVQPVPDAPGRSWWAGLRRAVSHLFRGASSCLNIAPCLTPIRFPKYERFPLNQDCAAVCGDLRSVFLAVRPASESAGEIIVAGPG
ncbi:hypothetical protein VT84_23720 [Gemmata sp. SH-PL17]|uniref:hypothetical protein n=1 Tax=Gemmata sp. SH-PL17 TaxID=1630693 RepID=UPI00078E5332|nr:hypothetical protein [Gemmata sp. SH-PL17]AMV27429.1 hypothetical protein VT84_23720 [Gemmata sp. SH-PL17]